MNERIKELAEQALKHPDTDNDRLTVFDNDELEKFAELIVRECSDIAIDNGCGDFVDINQLLLKHFGIEE